MVQGTVKQGGTYTIPGNNLRQHDMHTALGSTVWHVISDKVLEIDTMTGDDRGLHLR